MSLFQQTKLEPIQIKSDNPNKENRLTNVGNKIEVTLLNSPAESRKPLDYEKLIQGLMFFNQKASAEINSIKVFSGANDFVISKDYSDKTNIDHIPNECILESLAEIDDLWVAFHQQIKAGKQVLRHKESLIVKLEDQVKHIDSQNNRLEAQLADLSALWTKQNFASSGEERRHKFNETCAHFSTLLSLLKEKRNRLREQLDEVSLKNNLTLTRLRFEDNWLNLKDNCQKTAQEQFEKISSSVESLEAEKREIKKRFETEEEKKRKMESEKNRLLALIDSHQKELIIQHARVQNLRSMPLDLHSKSITEVQNSINRVTQRFEEKKKSLIKLQSQSGQLLSEKMSKELTIERKVSDLNLLVQSNQELEHELSQLVEQNEHLSVSLDAALSRTAKFDHRSLSIVPKEKELEDLEKKHARELAQMVELNNQELASEAARNESKLHTMQVKAKVLRELIGQMVAQNNKHFENQKC